MVTLWTSLDGWKLKDDNELRSYVNVLKIVEWSNDTKEMIVVKNYINGFDILEKQNFFGTHDKDINKDLMLIDKINMFYKSSKNYVVIFQP